MTLKSFHFTTLCLSTSVAITDSPSSLYNIAVLIKSFMSYSNKCYRLSPLLSGGILVLCERFVFFGLLYEEYCCVSPFVKRNCAVSDCISSPIYVSGAVSISTETYPSLTFIYIPDGICLLSSLHEICL